MEKMDCSTQDTKSHPGINKNIVSAGDVLPREVKITDYKSKARCKSPKKWVKLYERNMKPQHDPWSYIAVYFDRLVQEICDSIANALELHFSC